MQHLFTAMVALAICCASATAAQHHPPATHNLDPCEQQWRDLGQGDRQMAQDLDKEAAALRALLAMLRNDAGIVNDANVRDALQVNADMWDTVIAGLQKRSVSWQQRAQHDEARQSGCRAGEKPARQ